jgi:hypothetical protein
MISAASTSEERNCPTKREASSDPTEGWGTFPRINVAATEKKRMAALELLDDNGMFDMYANKINMVWKLCVSSGRCVTQGNSDNDR